MFTSKPIEDNARFKQRTICDEWTTPFPWQVVSCDALEQRDINH